MAQLFPNGTVFSISTGYKEVEAVSDVSNALPAVATLANGATSDLAIKDIVLINSGWAAIDGRIAQLSAVTSTSATLAGIDTTDTDVFIAGNGGGSLKAVDTWVDISQVAGLEKSGGDQQFYSWQYLEDKSNQQQQRPTFKNAKTIKLTLDYDPAKAWFTALEKSDEKAELVVLKAALPNGKKLYYPVYPSFDADPTMVMNQNMQNIATFSLAGKFTSYGA